MHLNELIAPKEKTYYSLLLFFACLAWLAIAITIVGIFYGLIISLFIWLGNGLLIANLKSNAIKVNDQQLSELNELLLDVCAKLEVTQVPELYIIQSDGILNAFATRHGGRDFIVIYSEALEAFGSNSDKMRFLIGHEIGHIKQRHLVKQLIIAPAMLVPLLGTAYSRARECTSDNHGAYACHDVNEAISAMMLLSGGKSHHGEMSADAFADQHHANRGFFISWFELISGYPTLSQRVSRLKSIQDESGYLQPSRHPIAYIFALFSAGGSRSGGSSILVTIAMIGILSAMILPALGKARKRAMEAQERNQLKQQEMMLQEMHELEQNQ